jgi:DNA excision repair protein ERCC-3
MLRLLAHGERLLLECDDAEVLHKLAQNVLLAPLVEFERGRCTVSADDRGALKQVLVRLGYPVDDRAGYRRGGKLPFEFRECTGAGRPFALRAYQKNAAAAF